MRPNITRLAALAVALMIAVSCGSPTAPDVPPGAIRVVGTIHYYTFEGGFWAVRGDDGITYDPLGGLPSGFQREGLRVSMVVKVRTDLIGIHNDGPIIEIIDIQPI